jgi:hypothetical protein
MTDLLPATPALIADPEPAPVTPCYDPETHALPARPRRTLPPATSTWVSPRRSRRSCASSVLIPTAHPGGRTRPAPVRRWHERDPACGLGRLLTHCVARTHCPHFGLLVGQRATILSLGIVGRLMLRSDTLGDALRALVGNLSLQDRAVVPSLTIGNGTALLTFATYQAESTSAEQILDAALGVVNTLRTLCGSSWHPVEVLLPKAAPADAEAYRRHFRAPARSTRRPQPSCSRPETWTCGLPGPIPCCGSCWRSGSSNSRRLRAPRSRMKSGGCCARG